MTRQLQFQLWYDATFYKYDRQIQIASINKGHDCETVTYIKTILDMYQTSSAPYKIQK